MNCDNSASSFGAPPHPTYFQSDFRSLVSGFEGSDACEHSRLHNSAFKPVTKLSPSASLSVPLGSDGFRPTYLLSAESFCKVSHGVR